MSASEPSRYLSALRYYAPIVLVLAALVSGATYGVFNADEEDYEATVRIARQDVARSAAPGDGESLEREMQTLAELVTTRPVITAAADQIDNESEGTLRKRVHASVEPGTNILRIVVEDDAADEASTAAYVVSTTFQAVRTGVVRAHLALVRKDLGRRILAATSPEVAATLRARQREIAASDALAGSDLFVVEAPVPPKARRSSSAVPEAAIAFGVVLLLGFAAALLRELIVPRVATARQLARLIGLEILGEVPRNPRRLGRHTVRGNASENAAYHVVRSALDHELQSDRPQILVVTSGFKGEGKTTATANLGRALADVGNRILLVGGDARNRDLTAAFAVDSEDGFSNLTTHTRQSAEDLVIEVETDQSRGGKLAVLPAGDPPSRPEAISEADVAAAFAILRALPYDVILVDSAPLLGAADARLLAEAADRTIVVVRIDRLSKKDALDLRDGIRHLEPSHTHLLVVGTAVARNRVLMPPRLDSEAVTTA